MSNVRRENKLYSYEDQLADMELRKEIERKKKAKGISVEPKLTKQQQEAMQVQLKKESEVRKKTKQVTVYLSKAINGFVRVLRNLFCCAHMKWM